MAKSKKGGRSSKTDHVLSLLGGNVPAAGQETPRSAAREAPAAPAAGEAEQPAEDAKQPAPAAAEPAGQPARQEGERLIAPILQVEKNNNEALSRTIRDALAESLAEAVGLEERTAEKPEPVEPGPTSAPEPVAAEPAPAPAEEKPEPVEPGPTSAPEPVAAEPAPEEPAPETPFAPRETRLPDGSVCVNMMELLVDERLERYVRMFGLCTCPRCMADARALALTRLPAKYVVLAGSAATPMTSLYRAKYESMVVAQVIQACKTVMESPRHTL